MSEGALYLATLPARLCQDGAEEHGGCILGPLHPVYATGEPFWAVPLDIQILILACFSCWLTLYPLPQCFPQPCKQVLGASARKDPISPCPCGPEPC